MTILRTATNGVLSLADSDGQPYGVPLSFVMDEGCKHIYFHSAAAGRKMDCIGCEARCSFCVVAQDRVVPEEFTTYYRSVMVQGRISVVKERDEILYGLRLLGAKYSPGIDPEAEIARFLGHVAVLRLDIESITGKEAKELMAERNRKGLEIREGRVTDLGAIMDCYEKARQYMRRTGNMTQWANGYPSSEIVLKDIAGRNSYVAIDEDGELVMAFAFIKGADPTYALIEDGEWLDADSPYGTIHRLGSTGKHRGMLSLCVRFCGEQTDNLRLDTHADNQTMRRGAEKLGFVRCGTIYCDDGTPRIAYQRISRPRKE